jgi:NAD dependent epimerase/dehydratase
LSIAGKKVLVTGAGGFIGSHLAETLVRTGASVRSMVRYSSSGDTGWLRNSEFASDMEIVKGDITDQDSVERAVKNVDVIFNLAALIGIPYSYEAPSSYVSVNINGGLNVFQAALKAGTGRVVQTSTSEVYGSAMTVPIDESHPLQAQSPYSASKIAADMLATSYYNSFNLPIVVFRPFNTYGPRQSQRAVIPTVIKQCMGGDMVNLGNIDPTRDLVYVSDTVAGFIAAGTADSAPGQVVHIGTGVDTSIGDLAKLIGILMGKEITIRSDTGRVRPPDSEVERLQADPSKAKELLGWSSEHDLESGLTKTIEWFKANPEALNQSGYVV